MNRTLLTVFLLVALQQGRAQSAEPGPAAQMGRIDSLLSIPSQNPSFTNLSGASPLRGSYHGRMRFDAARQLLVVILDSPTVALYSLHGQPLKICEGERCYYRIGSAYYSTAGPADAATLCLLEDDEAIARTVQGLVKD